MTQALSIGCDQTNGQANNVTETHTFTIQTHCLTVDIETDGPILFTGDLFAVPTNYVTTGTRLNGIRVDGSKVLGRNQIRVLPPGTYKVVAANTSGGTRFWMITLHLTGEQ